MYSGETNISGTFKRTSRTAWWTGCEERGSDWNAEYLEGGQRWAPLPCVREHGRATSGGRGIKVSCGHAGFNMPVGFIASAHGKAQWSCRSEEKTVLLEVCKAQIVFQTMGDNEINLETVL